jgi:hypothetical protein
MSKPIDFDKNNSLDTRKNFGNKILLKSNRLLEDVFMIWDKEKDKLKIASFLSEKYSLILSRSQLEALIRKARTVEK